MILTILIFLFPIIILLGITFLLFRIFLTVSKTRKPEVFGVILGLCYFSFVLIDSVNTVVDPYHGLVARDVSISYNIPLLLLKELGKGLLHIDDIFLREYIFPLVIDGVFGTIEFFFIGYVIAAVYFRIKKKSPMKD